MRGYTFWRESVPCTDGRGETESGSQVVELTPKY
jgi:hypothetical protein